MRDGGRIAAAIAVLEDIDARHRPVRLALKGWGESARYAGSKDRAFVSGLVLDALRRRRSVGWRMGDDGWRAVTLRRGPVRLGLGGRADRRGGERGSWSWRAQRGGGGAGWPIRFRWTRRRAPVRGDYPPDWLAPAHGKGVRRGRRRRGQRPGRPRAGRRADQYPEDDNRTDAEGALAPGCGSPRRLTHGPALARAFWPPSARRRSESLPEFAKGWFEVQDLGSQIAAAAASDIAHRQVLDFCAGGGGKTLALAAAMNNTGQLFAHDADARRLADTQRRAQRAGVRNLQVRSPLRPGALAGLEGRMDLVFVDAPCTGSGVWRRHPDAKGRLTPDQLARRMAEQDAVLDAAAPYAMKPNAGG